ncbi:MAG: phage portal protein, partial [Nocardioidaceae bacterium]
MGLGRLFQRNLTYDVTNTETGATGSYEVVIDKGIYPDWDAGNYRGGMGVPGAWRCALLLSDLIGGLPWEAFRRRGGRPVEKLDPTPPLLDHPDPDATRMDTFSAWALDLLWDGNAVALVADRNHEGYPTAVLPVPARFVQARRTSPSSNLPIGPYEYDIGGRRFDPYDVLHIRGPHEPGGLRGMGVLEQHLRGAIQLAKDQSSQAGSVSRHGVPTGLLKSTNLDATEDDLKAMKAGWLRNQQTRTIQAVNATTEFQPLSWNPEELQLVEARKYTLHEVALIFGVPLSFLGVEQSNRTYTNTELEAMNLLKFGAPSGMLARFEQGLTERMPQGTYAKASLDSLLRPDTKTRYEAHKIGIESGFLTVNEARELEDRPPLEPEPVDAEVVGQPAVEAARASELKHGQGSDLWDYWTHGKGLARWAGHLHP